VPVSWTTKFELPGMVLTTVEVTLRLVTKVATFWRNEREKVLVTFQGTKSTTHSMYL